MHAHFTEGWQSGLMQQSWKLSWRKSPWVRISVPPPWIIINLRQLRFFCNTRKGDIIYVWRYLFWVISAPLWRCFHWMHFGSILPIPVFISQKLVIYWLLSLIFLLQVYFICSIFLVVLFLWLFLLFALKAHSYLFSEMVYYSVSLLMLLLTLRVRLFSGIGHGK